MGFRKVDLRPALVAILLLALYSSTLLPGVGVHGDTAKFQFVGKIFGTPHETGYPLYLMLNHFFVLLFPFGTLAFKVNLLSSIFSALACVVMYFLLLKMNIHKTVAFVSALSFGASRCLWSQSLIAEVYSLNVFLISILLYFLIVWYHSRELQFLYIAIAIYAISFGNHLTMVTYAPAILFLILVTDYKLLFNYKVLLIFAALFALSVLQYSYFFFRYYNPSTPYLEMQTPTIYKLVWYLTGGRFKGNMFSFSFYDFITQRLPLFARLLFRNLYITLPFVLLGLFKLGKNWLNLFMLLFMGGISFYALNYDISDIFVYFIPAYLICFIYAAIGVNLLVKKVNIKKMRFIILLFPIAFVFFNYKIVDQSHNTSQETCVCETLNLIKRDALIVCPNYHYAQFFYYYLIGEKKSENNIYILSPFCADDELYQYITHETQLYIPEVRKYVPYGLRVILFLDKPRYLSIFDEDKFSIHRLTNKVYEIEPKK